MSEEWEVWRAIHVITERRDGATYKTEFVCHGWVPMGVHGRSEEHTS